MDFGDTADPLEYMKNSRTIINLEEVQLLLKIRLLGFLI